MDMFSNTCIHTFDCNKLADLFEKIGSKSNNNHLYFQNITIFLKQLGNEYKPQNFEDFGKFLIQNGVAAFSFNSNLKYKMSWSTNHDRDPTQNYIQCDTIAWFIYQLCDVLTHNFSLLIDNNIENKLLSMIQDTIIIYHFYDETNNSFTINQPTTTIGIKRKMPLQSSFVPDKKIKKIKKNKKNKQIKKQLTDDDLKV